MKGADRRTAPARHVERVSDHAQLAALLLDNAPPGQSGGRNSPTSQAPMSLRLPSRKTAPANDQQSEPRSNTMPVKRGHQHRLLHPGGYALPWIAAILAAIAAAVPLGKRRTARPVAAPTDTRAAPTPMSSAPPADDPAPARDGQPRDGRTPIAESSTPVPERSLDDARRTAEAAPLLGHAGEHRADERTRAVAWLVVGVIIAGTGVSGAALIAAAPWLFCTGVGIAVLGIVWGRAAHAMRDQTQIRSNER
jgi:hypothetical protein